ncbi:MAG TPA: hypothetical protein VGF39_03895 [Stellaceae bacterium]|jgi:hypothetical protein
MARIPKTKAGKERKVARTMGEFKEGGLKSSSGERVTNPKQAVAIALNQTGQSKPPSERKRRAKPPSGRSAPGGAIASEISRRIDERQARR